MILLPMKVTVRRIWLALDQQVEEDCHQCINIGEGRRTVGTVIIVRHISEVKKVVTSSEQTVVRDLRPRVRLLSRQCLLPRTGHL